MSARKPACLSRSMRAGSSLLLLALLCVPVSLPAGQSQPGVEKIMADYVAATGGKAAYAHITSTITTGTFTVPIQKLSGSFVVRAKAPNKLLIVQDVPGVGKSEQGFDGKTGWARDPHHGLRTLAGVELEQMRQQARFNGPLYWKEMYSKAELVGARKVGTAQTHCIRLTPKAGRPSTQYYDINTKLMLRMDQVVEQPEGAIPTESYLSDYRVVDGVKTPFLVRQVLPSIGELLLKTISVKYNVKMDDSLFAKPASASGEK